MYLTVPQSLALLSNIQLLASSWIDCRVNLDGHCHINLTSVEAVCTAHLLTLQKFI